MLLVCFVGYLIVSVILVGMYCGIRELIKWLLVSKAKIRKENFDYIWVGIVAAIILVCIICVAVFHDNSHDNSNSTYPDAEQDDIHRWFDWGIIGIMILGMTVMSIAHLYKWIKRQIDKRMEKR